MGDSSVKSFRGRAPVAGLSAAVTPCDGLQFSVHDLSQCPSGVPRPYRVGTHSRILRTISPGVATNLHSQTLNKKSGRTSSNCDKGTGNRERRARLAGGCLLGSVDVATQKYGLVFPAGVVSHTGASGLILGGGFGWLTRRFGLSCDNVEGLTLVTADGSVVHASSKDNANLFWALRGGGGNFGVVTEFEVKLHPLKSVVLGEGLCLGDDIPRLLRHWRDFMPQAPDDLKWNLSLRLALNGENVPGRVRERPVLSQSVLWTGDPKESRRCLDHALSICKPIEVTRRVLSFLALQTMADSEFPHGLRYYTKSGYFKTLDYSSIDHMEECMANNT